MGAETAIDPGGDAVSGNPPLSPAADGEGGEGRITEARGEAPTSGGPAEAEEAGARRLSLQAVGGVAKEQEGEELKSRGEGGSADSEQVTTETDGEEGTWSRPRHFERL